MTTKAERETLPSANQCLQHDHDLARSLHRVVRAMHDGECPKCHKVHASVAMEVWDRSGDTGSGERFYTGWRCPSCKFAISKAEATAALEQFAPFMEQNLAVFEKWRAERTSPTPAAPNDGQEPAGRELPDGPGIWFRVAGEYWLVSGPATIDAGFECRFIDVGKGRLGPLNFSRWQLSHGNWRRADAGDAEIREKLAAAEARLAKLQTLIDQWHAGKINGNFVADETAKILKGETDGK